MLECGVFLEERSCSKEGLALSWELSSKGATLETYITRQERARKQVHSLQGPIGEALLTLPAPLSQKQQQIR